MNQVTNTSKQELKEQWYLIDAAGLRIGKLSTTIAELLLGKNNPQTRSYLLPQNKVVVINAAKLDVPVRKQTNKVYTQYSGYPGGLRKDTLEEMFKKFPERVIERAVKGMLPRNRRGKAIHAQNLYVYASSEHKHAPQQPQVLDMTTFKI